MIRWEEPDSKLAKKARKAPQRASIGEKHEPSSIVYGSQSFFTN